MAKTLKEQLWPLVKEYTRQVKDIMCCSDAHWIGTDDNGSGPADILDLDGYFFLSWSEVQMLVDRYDEWKARYTADGVREEVEAWQQWFLDNMEEHSALELWESRRERYLRTYPRINLEHWLMGCPRDMPKQSEHDRLRELKVKREIVKELADEYRDSRSLWNIINNLDADIKAYEAKIKELDK